MVSPGGAVAALSVALSGTLGTGLRGGHGAAGGVAPLPSFPVKFICCWMPPHPPCPTLTGAHTPAATPVLPCVSPDQLLLAGWVCRAGRRECSVWGALRTSSGCFWSCTSRGVQAARNQTLKSREEEASLSEGALGSRDKKVLGEGREEVEWECRN